MGLAASATSLAQDKFQLDGTRWLVDHANPARAHDGFGGFGGFGGFNSLLVLG